MEDYFFYISLSKRNTTTIGKSKKFLKQFLYKGKALMSNGTISLKLLCFATYHESQGIFFVFVVYGKIIFNYILLCETQLQSLKTKAVVSF